MSEAAQIARVALRRKPVADRGWRPYPTYRDSGIEWLGQVPAEWLVRRLKYLGTLVVEPAIGPALDLPFLGLENIESWMGRLGSGASVDGEAEGDGGIVFQAGDLLFSKLRPYLAKAIAPTERGRCTSELLVLRPRLLVPRFALYVMLSRGFIETVHGSTFGTKMPRANWDFIGNMWLPYPDVVEQRVIAAFLDRETARIDALVAKIEQHIALLREHREALVTAAVTGEIDVREEAA
ncbi:MAG: hypothetical protein HYV63_15470 [Candidatus Schekmanbacteria bacterium]|nr:hypothetical protein [Candidatus Schekmanbacteria bacterium]